jgi:hypothetical protein
MSDILTLAFVAALYLSIVAYTAYTAKRVGRSPVLWGLGAAILGVFALGLLIGISVATKSKGNAA